MPEFCPCGIQIVTSETVYCAECDEPICAAHQVQRSGEPHHELCAERVNERAYERSCAAFYGSSAPQTDLERQELARRPR